MCSARVPFFDRWWKFRRQRCAAALRTLIGGRNTLRLCSPIDSLLVDHMNEQDFLRVLVADLEAESLRFGDVGDCHIVRCRTGEAALKRLERAQFDVVLVDQALPDVSGLELMRQVLTYCPEATRVLLMSGATMRAATHAINDVNIHHLLDKPFNLALMRNVFDTARSKAFARRRNVELLQRVQDQNRALESLNRELGNLVSARTLTLLEALMAALEYRDTETR